MAQVTKDMCEHIIAAAARHEYFPLTPNEMRQLAYLAMQAIASAATVAEPSARFSDMLVSVIVRKARQGKKFEHGYGAVRAFLDGAHMLYEAAQQQAEPGADERRIMQLAAISTAAFGYWKEGDSIHPDYDTTALRDTAKLYAKYDELFKAAQSGQRAGVAEGWQLVPKEPTKTMLDAAERLDWSNDDVRGNCCNQWNAMLAAAPTQQQEGV